MTHAETKIILITTDSICGMESASMVYRYAKEHDIPAYVDYIGGTHDMTDLLFYVKHGAHPQISGSVVAVDDAVFHFMPFHAQTDLLFALSALREDPSCKVLVFETLHELSKFLNIPIPDMTTDDHAHAAEPYIGGRA